MKQWSTTKKVVVFGLLALLLAAVLFAVKFISDVTDPSRAFSQALAGDTSLTSPTEEIPR